MNGLLIGNRDNRQQGHDRDGDREGKLQSARAGQGEDGENFLGCVGRG